MLIDIHTHTYPTSDDSNLTPQDLISEAKKVGLDGICITDHDGFWNPRDIEKIGIDNDFLVLPGCEVTTEEGHLLVYGLDKYIFGMHKSAFVKELVAESQGAIVVAAAVAVLFFAVPLTKVVLYGALAWGVWSILKKG